MWPELVDELSLTDKTLFSFEYEPSFTTLIARAWKRSWATGKSCIASPFHSMDEALRCAPVKTLEQKMREMERYLFPDSWAHQVWRAHGPALLSMMHLNPDMRPKSVSLCLGLCEGKRLDEWQRVTREIVTMAPIAKAMKRPLTSASCLDSQIVLMGHEDIRQDKESASYWLRHPEVVASILADQSVPSCRHVIDGLCKRMSLKTMRSSLVLFLMEQRNE